MTTHPLHVAIRNETSNDAAAIHRLVREAFANAEHRSGTEQHIVDALRTTGALTLSLVAADGDALLGHAAFSPVTLSDGSDRWFGLGPVCVLPDRQRSGIGSRLIEQGLLRLRELGASGCVVLGDPVYYRRFGFQPESAPVLPGVPPAYFQALAFDGAVPMAEVSYHPAFSAHA